jgi:proline iminopeptidase
MLSTSEFVQVGETSIWTAWQGNGPPLVLCHGGPGMWDYLGPVAELIDDLRTVYRYDQRACGRSSGESQYSLARAVADLEELRAHFEIDRWIVGGHSFGASLALAYCLEHPDRAQGLLYISGTGIDPGWHAAYRANRDARLGPEGLRRYAELREQIAQSEGAVKAAAERAHAELGASTDLADPSRAAEIVQAVWSEGLPVNFEVNRTLGADAAQLFEVDAIRTRIAGLLTLTLIVHGEADPRPLWSARALAELLPNAQLAAISDCAHYPWFEQPELFQDVLRGFLARALRPGTV